MLLIRASIFSRKSFTRGTISFLARGGPTRNSHLPNVDTGGRKYIIPIFPSIYCCTHASSSPCQAHPTPLRWQQEMKKGWGEKGTMINRASPPPPPIIDILMPIGRIKKRAQSGSPHTSQRLLAQKWDVISPADTTLHGGAARRQ